MRLFIVLVAIAISSFTFAQTNDQIMFVHLDYTDCLDKKQTEHIQDRIISTGTLGSITMYEIGVKGDCEGYDSFDVALHNDSLNLIFKKSPTPLVNEKGDTIYFQKTSKCNCYFQYRYYIYGLYHTDYTVLANGGAIDYSQHKYSIEQQAASFDVIGNDTINFVNIYGFKEGIHREFNEDKKVTIEEFYKNYNREYRCVFTYYETGELKEKWIVNKDGINTNILYYKNGNIQKECMSQNLEILMCKEYNEQGILK
jgi:antitoxin component YwqK of YwqJK toxin-antitoxin module